MTNEENINNAATNYGYAVAGGCIERGYIQDAFETGAKWKERQLKEYLEKKKSVFIDLREMWQPDSYEFGVYDGQIDILDEIINKLFGGE